MNNKIKQIYFFNGESILLPTSKEKEKITFIYNDDDRIVLKNNTYNVNEFNNILDKEKKIKLIYALSLLKKIKEWDDFNIIKDNSLFSESSISGTSSNISDWAFPKFNDSNNSSNKTNSLKTKSSYKSSISGISSNNDDWKYHKFNDSNHSLYGLNSLKYVSYISKKSLSNNSLNEYI